MVWGWAEDKIRELEKGDESFEEWKKIVPATLKSYPAPEKLVGGMATWGNPLMQGVGVRSTLLIPVLKELRDLQGLLDINYYQTD